MTRRTLTIALLASLVTLAVGMGALVIGGRALLILSAVGGAVCFLIQVGLICLNDVREPARGES